MSGGLDTRFVHAIMGVLQNPAVQIDIALGLFFPEVAKRQAEFNEKRIQSANQMVNMAAMYDYLQTEFPAAPLRESVPDAGPDFLFREMLKHIVAAALNVKYETPIKVVTH